MKDVMIDIETLATRHDSAIIQIGAVLFDAKTGEVGSPFLVSVDQTFYDNDPVFYVDEKTKAWWNAQSKDAQKALEINKVLTPYIALDRMLTWFQDVGFTKSKYAKNGTVWANPPQFDLAILRHAALKAYGSADDVPWHYRQERDFRTLNAVLGPIGWQDLGEAGEGLTPHRADHDAIRQVLMVKKLAEKLS